MDSHIFASLAHVRVLLLPVGSIEQAAFDRYAVEVRSFSEIRLGDIPSDHKDERARFMPNPLSTGHLHVSFSSHRPPLSHNPLALFRPSHFPLGVVGIAVCSETDSLSSTLAQFNTSVLDKFPDDSMFPLAKKLFVFEESDGKSHLNITGDLPGLVVIPSMMGNKRLYIGTVLADLCSHILGEFGRVVQTLESPLGNEYLNATLLPTLPCPSDLPSLLDDSIKRSSLPPLPSHSSQPELSVISPSATTKRNSSYGSASTVSGSGPKKRQTGIGAASSHGRLFKVLGDFFLLAGKTEDAAIWYTEAIVLLKTSPQDAIWHASALEGVAVVSVLDAWSTGFGLQTSVGNGVEPWSNVSEKLTQAIGLYSKSTPNADPEQPYPLLAYLYTSAVLRQVSLLFSVWSSKGWGPLAFTSMIQASASYLPPTLSRAETVSCRHLERLSAVTGISRSFIGSTLSQAHGPWLLHLGPGERIVALEAMAGIYACLGYKRKEVYILREVLGCIMDLLVCGREESEGDRSTTTTNGAGLGIQGIQLGEVLTDKPGNVGMRQGESTKGNESILRLLKYICKVLGINLDAVKLITPESRVDADVENKESSFPAKAVQNDALDTFQDPYGWPELQVGVVREAVAVAEALPDHLAVAQFTLSALKTLHMVLAPGDQCYLYSLSGRALTTARRRGDTRCVDFWSGRPIVNLSISQIPFARLPIEKPLSVLLTTSEVSPIVSGAKDPFLYNPRKSIAGQAQTLVVQNEPLELVVTLQNPFVFDLEFQSLDLSTSGVPFESKAIPVVVPSKSVHCITIIGKALQPGNLIIQGCLVRAPGGAARHFMLPLSTDEEEDKLSRKRSSLECEAGRSKYSGLDSRPWERVAKRLHPEPETPNNTSVRFLQCKVVPEQPLLRIRRTSLTHGAVMLYNGEMSTIHITLENVSSLPIDFLRLAFDDSTIAPAQQALADGDLSVFDTYEKEYDLLHRPMFSWSKEKGTWEVGPGQKITLTVICCGKVGCTSGTIHVSYSYVHRKQPMHQELNEIFHTRQISYPVSVTVYHMLECQSMDILPYSTLETTDGLRKDRLSVLRIDDEAGWCLFSIEVRNMYGLPFDVTFERTQPGTSHSSTMTTVPPGSTTRIVIPVKKFLLTEDHVAAAIPTLSDRQFVVTNSNLTSTEEKTQRELFWYREALFKHISGHWKESGGTREGDISLRQQRLTKPMLENLRTEKARVHISLIPSGPNPQSTITQRGGRYLPQPNQFVRLRTKVTNLSLSPLVLTLDFTLKPAEHIIHEGSLSDVPVGRLESGGSCEIDMIICFLAYGHFQIDAEVRNLEASFDDGKAGVGQLVAVVRELD